MPHGASTEQDVGLIDAVDWPVRWHLAAAEQEIPGHVETIEYEDDKGKWHTETASGQDRPHTVVKDKD